MASAARHRFGSPPANHESAVAVSLCRRTQKKSWLITNSSPSGAFRLPQEKVWDLIFHSENWPQWWPGVEKVEKLKEGDANHVGAIHRYTWKSKLPYRLIFEMESTRVEPISIIEGRAIGELQGVGRWQLSNDGEITTARYDWKVETTKAWMNLLAPIARPFFSWNHNVVMGWGGAGLAKRLGAEQIM